MNYARLVSTVNRLIADFGKPATLVKPTASGPAYDRVEGEPQLSPITVVDLNIRHMVHGGTLVVNTTRTLFMGTAGGVEPVRRDFVRLSRATANAFSLAFSTAFEVLLDEEAADFKIAEVRPLQPGPTVLMWELDLE